MKYSSTNGFLENPRKALDNILLSIRLEIEFVILERPFFEKIDYSLWSEFRSLGLQTEGKGHGMVFKLLSSKFTKWLKKKKVCLTKTWTSYNAILSFNVFPDQWYVRKTRETLDLILLWLGFEIKFCPV